jgi:Na+-driven multidrug efflux pump
VKSVKNGSGTAEEWTSASPCRAAAAAGAALSRVGAGVVGVVGVVLWFIRVPLLSAFTSDAAVVDAALVSYPLIVVCVFTFW